MRLGVRVTMGFKVEYRFYMYLGLGVSRLLAESGCGGCSGASSRCDPGIT